jgi:glycosidase
MKSDFQLVHPQWAENAVIYEVNIRQYTAGGGFTGFLPHLERLKAMGVDILWFMPVNPIGTKNRKGSLGSYYAVRDYRAVNPEFGSAGDFRKVIDKAHSLGMRVIIDWVANHTAFDHPWVEQHPEWYKKDDNGDLESPFDWTDVLALDYNNSELREAMARAMEFWVKDFDIDGFRCDVAMLVPAGFWNDVRLRLEKIKPVFMLAEAEQPDLNERAFDAFYGWELFKVMKAVAKGEDDAGSIRRQIELTRKSFPPYAWQMLFTTNHDENSWNGTEYEMFGDASRTFAVLTFLIMGIPLIYSGQEAGLNKRLKFFEKDEIDWSKMWAEDFYRSLTGIKKRNVALKNGSAGGEQLFIENNGNGILSFARTTGENTVLVFVNLTKYHQTAAFVTGDFSGNYINSFTSGPVEITAETVLRFDPWQYYVFER